MARNAAARAFGYPLLAEHHGLQAGTYHHSTCADEQLQDHHRSWPGAIDGKFDHVGKIKGPILRGLSARAPYFHNGSARTLLDAVHFYESRFGLVLTHEEESDLVAFLSSL